MNILFVSGSKPTRSRADWGRGWQSADCTQKPKNLGVRILCPLHRCCKTRESLTLNTFQIGGRKRLLHAKLAETRLPESEVPVYFLENDFLYDRPGIYADNQGDYRDNPSRVFGLCETAMFIESITGWRPGVFHAHDWMAAPVCAFLNAEDTGKGKQASVLTIHNLEHQGKGTYEDLSVPVCHRTIGARVSIVSVR